MRLKRFRDRSLIMGSFLVSQALHQWIKSNSEKANGLSFLGSLILVAIHFEDKAERTGPSRLARTLGFSRSRISQEISILAKLGLIKRSLDSLDARTIGVSLSSAGEKQALETIKRFTRLQSIVDRAVGEKAAEDINASLLRLAEHLQEVRAPKK